MNETKKEIIVAEIVKWRKSHLLPEQYCDFLLALYTGGNEQVELKAPAVIKKSLWKKHYLFLLLIPIEVFLIHFTELSFILQIAFSFLFAISGFIFTFYFTKKRILLQIPLFTSALIVLVFTADFISTAFPDSEVILYIVIFSNCLLWFMAGWKFKMISFIISGVLGIILVAVSIFI